MWNVVTRAPLFCDSCQDDAPGAQPPGLYHLYLLHPTFPSILLDLTNTTGIVTASEGESPRHQRVYLDCVKVLPTKGRIRAFQETVVIFPGTPGARGIAGEFHPSYSARLLGQECIFSECAES